MKIQSYLAFILILISSSLHGNLTKEQWEKMKTFYTDMPVLVAGGCGFIGSCLAEKLVELGAYVTIIDNLSTGSIDHIKNTQDKINFIQKDITDMAACLQATQNQHIIFHLAAHISVPESMSNPQLCNKTNVNGTFNLLEAARINHVDRFVFSSSAAVYGPQATICTEEMPCMPTSPYGFSKLIGELYCKQYAQTFGVPTIMLRYFNVYGPRQNPQGAYAAVVAKFKHAMKHNVPITIFGDGMQTRDFIPVDQIVEANLFLAMLDTVKTNGQIFNIATGKSISLLELIEQLKPAYPNYNEHIQFKPERPGDIKHSHADSAKYQQLMQ